MRQPDIVLSFDRELGEHFEFIDVDSEALQAVLSNNLTEEPKADVLPIHFQYPFIEEAGNLITRARYYAFERRIACSLKPHKAEHQGLSTNYHQEIEINERLLHETGHYVDMANDSKARLMMRGLRRVKYATAGLASLVTALAAGSTPQEVLPIDRDTVTYALMTGAVAAVSLQILTQYRFGPSAFRSWAAAEYRSGPEEVFANEFAEREIAKLDTPLITLTPRSQS